MTMRVSVLIRYTVGYNAQMGGRRKTKTSFEIVDIPIRTEDPEDAPVAISWNDLPDKIQYAKWGAHERNGDGHTRWFADRHWRPVLAAGSQSAWQTDNLDLSTLSSLSTSATPYHQLLGNFHLDNPKPPKNRPTDVTDEILANVIGDSRNYAIEQCRAALSKLLLVDGIVYAPCHEPMVVTTRVIRLNGAETKLDSLRIITDADTIDAKMRDSLHKVSPVTRFEEMLDMNCLFDAEFSARIDARRRPEIFEMESVNEDAWMDASAKIALEQFEMHFRTKAIGTLTAEQIVSMGAAKTSVMVEDLEDRLEAMAAALRSCAREWGNYPANDELRKIADDISAREITVPMTHAFGASPRP